MGPQHSRLKNTMPANNTFAKEPSTRWRISLPRFGTVRNRVGAVPGRRPTKRPPVSEGSVRICSYLRSDADRRGSARVKGVEDVGVLLVDDVALDLQPGRELTGRLGEVVVQDGELLDLLDLRVSRVDAVDLPLDQLVDLGALRQRGDVLGEAVLARVDGDLFLVEGDQHHRVGALIAVHHRLGDP